MDICLQQGADLHMAQLMPLPLTVSCFSKIQIGFAFLVPAHPGSPGQRAVKRVCVCVCVCLCVSIFCVLGLKMPMHAPKMGVLRVKIGKVEPFVVLSLNYIS